jgi:hypothetical protein
MLAANLLVPNSGDIQAANSTFQPLWDFIACEQAAGRPLNVTIETNVLSNYYDMWPGPPGQLDEGEGRVAILGSRLLPASMFEEGKVDGLVDLLLHTQLYPIFHLGALHSIHLFPVFPELNKLAFSRGRKSESSCT